MVCGPATARTSWRCVRPGEVVPSVPPVSAKAPVGENLSSVGFDDVPQVFVVVWGVEAEGGEDVPVVLVGEVRVARCQQR